MQAFLAVLLASPALDLSQPALKAAGIAGLASVMTMAHRLLDETPVPTMPDAATARSRPVRRRTRARTAS